MDYCNPNGVNKPVSLTKGDAHPLNQFVEKFERGGMSADYTSRRGSKIIQVILGYSGSGIRSYLAGRPQKFSDEYEINNGVVKQIELLGEAQMPLIPTNPPTDPLDQFFSEGWLVLIDNCNQEVAKIPLSQLNKEQNGGKAQFCNFAGLDWKNCYVLFPAAAGISEANSMVFQISIE